MKNKIIIIVALLLTSCLCLAAFLWLSKNKNYDTVFEQPVISSPLSSAEKQGVQASGKKTDNSILDSLLVIELDSQYATAIVRLPNTALASIRVGEQLHDSRAVLSSVAADKLVFKENITQADGTEVIQDVWVYKAVDGQSHVQRLHQHAPALPASGLPVSMPLDSGSTIGYGQRQ